LCVTIGFSNSPHNIPQPKAGDNTMRMQTGAIAISVLFYALFGLDAPILRTQTKTAIDADKDPSPPSGLEKRFLDATANPCVDFARYTCGNFSKYYPIPEDRSSYDVAAVISAHMEYTLHSLLEKASADDHPRTPNEQKIGDFYASCMDVNAIQAAGLKPFQPELDRIAALKDKNELTDLLAHYQLISVRAFFSFDEQQDFKDARKQIAVADENGMGLYERDYYFNVSDASEKIRKQYTQHITNMLKLLGEPDTRALDDAKKIMQFETRLARSSLPITSRMDPNQVYHLTSVSRMGELIPEISWTRLIERTGTPQITELNVPNPAFFQGLSALLKSTDLQTIKTYLRWRLVASLPSYVLPAALDDERFNFFDRQLSGQSRQRDRWKRCTEAAAYEFDRALGEIYVKSYFPPTSKLKTVQMVKDVEDAMDKELDTLSWMSTETRARAKVKLHLVADKVGYPDRWKDYSSVKIVRGDPFGNALRKNEFDNRGDRAKIGQPLDRGEWVMSPLVVDAHYEKSLNDMTFPAGILQAPFFDPQSTDAENFGVLGDTVGHELTHAFDDRGRLFDGYGNLSDWWTAQDAKNFTAMTDCEEKEYSGFTAVDDVKVNGKLTVSENTADNGGLRLAYGAFQTDARRKSVDLNAKDDSGFTPVQQFFVSYGQSWCGTNRPEEIRLQVQTSPHAPFEFRINGVVQNMPEFGAAFGCKTGQPMMPANACHVW
jgi:putative endopeptidase